MSQIYSLSDNTNFVLDIYGGVNPCGSYNPTIRPNEFCTINVSFCPKKTGTINTNLTVMSNDSDTPTFNVPITGSARALILFSEFIPSENSTISQELDPLSFFSVSGWAKAIESWLTSGISTENLNAFEAFLARQNLQPISHSVTMCAVGSTIDWNNIKMYINGKDVTKYADISQLSTSNCDSSGFIVLQKYWINEDVHVNVSVQTTGGTSKNAEWIFSVKTKWLWPMAKNAIKGEVLAKMLRKLSVLEDILESLFIPQPAVSE